MTGRVGSLFSGVGALDLAVHQALAVEPAWFAENDRAASRVLAHHWPQVPNHGDVTAVDWGSVEPVDVLTGGFPCTDVSSAGRRAGLRPGTRSGLWSHMSYAISVLRPRLVVIENVRGLLSAAAHRDVEPGAEALGDGQSQPVLRAIGAVLGDLSDRGYVGRWVGLRAADVGAPHGRFRVFIAAWPARDADSRNSDRWRTAGLQGQAGPTTGPAAHAAGQGGGRHDPEHVGVHGSQAVRPGQAEPEHLAQAAGRTAEPGERPGAIAWGDYTPAIRRWERALGRLAPAPTQPGKRGGQQLSAAFTEWMMGWPQGWVTDVPGLSRNEQLKLCGNGVVPQQAVAALEWLLDVPLERAS